MLSTRLSVAMALAATCSARAAVLALAARQSDLTGCAPSFEGHPVSIIYGGSTGVDELAVTGDVAGANVITRAMSARTPEFLVENSGKFPASYLIKDQNDHELVAYATTIPRADAAIKLNAIDDSEQDDRQYWFLSCATCADPSFPVPPGGVFGTSCQIANVALDLCIQQTGVLGDPPVLAPCDASEPNQLFNFLREFL
ncbi:hypothetical protein GGX14DRAFT_570009 [Mycena pura]|uniref:Uncharacterized protein n=1 Tax=Mycena pura TaxID=153505 RepID=A0AAD6Y9B2_9AGAR|nr:hypothetical protein GGX14DRAFT_570009 [Mycena pura]